jgi:hypothetical protein
MYAALVSFFLTETTLAYASAFLPPLFQNGYKIPVIQIFRLITDEITPISYLSVPENVLTNQIEPHIQWPHLTSMQQNALDYTCCML